MNFTCIGFGTVFIIAGILFSFRKLLPRAFRQLSAEEKSKINIKPLCVNIGVMIILCGTILLAKGLFAAFSGKAFTAAMVVWLIISGIDIFYISKSKRYKK